MLDKTDQSIQRAEFLQLAKTISEDPLTRIPQSTHNDLDPQKVKSQNKVFIDVHAHSFTLSHVPANFVKALNFLSTKYKAKILGWLQKSLAKFMGQEDAISILNHLTSDYKAVLGQHNLAPKVYIVNLMMDMQRGIGGDLDKSY
ncbi:hypothetical protein N9B82_06370, partial [Saprospiraceae bacterium]|nr:hypothetical protein [Saprospiraceae bacterium]